MDGAAEEEKGSTKIFRAQSISKEKVSPALTASTRSLDGVMSESELESEKSVSKEDEGHVLKLSDVSNFEENFLTESSFLDIEQDPIKLAEGMMRVLGDVTSYRSCKLRKLIRKVIGIVFVSLENRRKLFVPHYYQGGLLGAIRILSFDTNTTGYLLQEQSDPFYPVLSEK